MKDFLDILKSNLEERGQSINEIIKDEIVSENTLYKYRKRNPNLKTLIKIANYLEFSIDYLFDLTEENDFHPYLESENFYTNLINLISAKKISGRKFCSDLNYSKDNLNRWKNGVQPSVRTLVEIAKYLNCTIDELIR